VASTASGLWALLQGLTYHDRATQLADAVTDGLILWVFDTDFFRQGRRYFRGGTMAA
jgi:hypothetical protein